MIIAITEHNAWENARWTVGLDLNQQKASTINDLHIFAHCANTRFDEMRQNAGRGGLFAASRYSIKFYDGFTRRPDGIFVLTNTNGGGLTLNGNSYKSSYVDTSLKISPQRMRSAMVRMRDKGENQLYKD